MEEIARSSTATGHGVATSLHRDSHAIAKQRPKVRIVHIFPPEVIKADAASFRDLVQKLTGNQAYKNHGRSRGMKKMATTHVPVLDKKEEAVTCEVEAEAEVPSCVHGGWNEGDCGLSGDDQYGDLDGFLQGLIRCSQAPSATTSEEDLFGGSSVSGFSVD